jgi:hypothetical protein
MSSASKHRKWTLRNWAYFIVGLLLLGFAFAPLPIGLGMMYPITDALRGHPVGPHGAQPKNLVGLWVREESVMYDFVGQAFYLMPDGRLAGMSGMTTRRWHFDEGRLFVDSVSRCGNCYRGNVTAEYTIRFSGPDQLLVNNTDKNGRRGIAGKYRRVGVTGALKSRMSRLAKATDEAESFRGRMVLKAIENFEALSQFKP